MINKVTLVGNLGQDPELKYIPSGTAVATFSVATTYGSGDKKETEWHNVVAWDKTAEACSKFLKKGAKVYIEGRNKTRSWDKDGTKMYRTEVHATEVKFLDSKPQDGGGGSSSTGRAQGRRADAMPDDGDGGVSF